MAEEVVSIADLIADPDATLRRIRARGSIVPFDFGQLVVKYEVARELLLDRRLAPSFVDLLHQFGITSGSFYDWMSLSPLNTDGEDHKRWRQLMARTFTPRSVEKLRPFLRAEAERLVDEFVDAGECEFVSAFARKLPSLGLCELIGVPSADREKFSGWADTVGLGFNIAMLTQRIHDVDAALDELLAYASARIAERRRDPKDDLVTRIALAADEEGGFSEALITGSVAGLVFAGHETTKNQLGWMLAVLAEVPAEWERVASDPTRARDVVEEILRFRSAATSLGRTATEEVTYGGAAMPPGTRIIVSLWGANRDPAAFADPDRFDVDAHKEVPQLAFGHGPHHCLGAALARAELQEALLTLTSRITCPRVLPGATFLPPLGINGPLTLPIAFERAPAR